MLVRDLRACKYYWNDTEISSSEYSSIRAKIIDKPVAPPGYEYRLSDGLNWIMCELTPDDGVNEELSADDALAIIIGGDTV